MDFVGLQIIQACRSNWILSCLPLIWGNLQNYFRGDTICQAYHTNTIIIDNVTLYSVSILSQKSIKFNANTMLSGVICVIAKLGVLST